MFYRYDAEGRLYHVIRNMINADNYKYYTYMTTNQFGDVIDMRDGNGTVYVKYNYDSWGRVVSVTNANGVAYAANSYPHYMSVRYRGYVYDSDTGLYYLQSRYYDPEVGRFLNADAVDYIGYSGEQLSYNVFAYCENNAVNCVDPLGFWKIGAWIVSTSLDILFSVLNSAMAAGYLTFSSTIYLLARSPYTRKKAVSIIKNKVIPVYVRGFYNFALTNIRKVLQTFGRVGREFAKGWTSNKVTNYIKKFVNIDPIDFVLSTFTWGGLISLVFDCLDGQWDGFITINNRR